MCNQSKLPRKSYKNRDVKFIPISQISSMSEKPDCCHFNYNVPIYRTSLVSDVALEFVKWPRREISLKNVS